MKSAVVTDFGQPPKYTTVPDLPPAAPETLNLRVLAVGIPNVVRVRAAGRHFLKTTLPHVPGIDGIGLDETTGKKYYFTTLALGTGTLADMVNVPKKDVVDFPDDADPATVAALVNPAQSSWMALRKRTENLPKDWSVVILGVTSASGRIAVATARALGAGRVIGVARDEGAMSSIEGLDERVVLKDDPSQTDFSRLGQVDVVLDYIWGKAAIALLNALQPTREVQFVQIGDLSGQEDMAVPASLLRKKMITLRGAGPGAWTGLVQETGELLKAVKGMKSDDVYVAKMSDVERVWDSPEVKGKRLVFVS
ncbi:hypothetical protein DL767_005188 [Monosporascus sp. MG133]|nr:hypothetical protein DL767_005188 [Monosporascus sp. MG133]